MNVAMSHYLALRHLPRSDMSWDAGICPQLPEPKAASLLVSSTEEVLAALDDLIPRRPGTGILLSGGIDSAILAALAPSGTPCFTIAFDAPGALDESLRAAEYAAHFEHPHHVVRIGWVDYLTHTSTLMATKNAPLHPVEVPLYVTSLFARTEGVDTLLVGNGADSTFGGMDKLLAHDWSFDEFVERYQFVDPHEVLHDAVSVDATFEPYRCGTGIDVHRFLHEVHGQGIVQSFENAIGAAGVRTAAPYEALEHDGPLDLDRIRSGEPKYLIQEAFRRLYETGQVPRKVAFARPTDVWLSNWPGPRGRPEFRDHVAMQAPSMDGEGLFLLWCLTAFLDHLDERLLLSGRGLNA